MGDCGPWGGAGEELLGATLDGTAGRRPNRDYGPRAAAEAPRHNVTKPHRPRTYRDAGRERASGAAGRSTRQAGASTSRRHWPWTRMESRASSGPEEKYDTGAVMRTSDGRSNRRFIYAATGHAYQSPIVIADNLIAAEHQIKALQERIQIVPLI